MLTKDLFDVKCKRMVDVEKAVLNMLKDPNSYKKEFCGHCEKNECPFFGILLEGKEINVFTDEERIQIFSSTARNLFVF